MRKDTQSFLITLLTIPTLLLTGVFAHSSLFPKTVSLPEQSAIEVSEEPEEVLVDNEPVVEIKATTPAPVPVKTPASVTPTPIATPTPAPTPAPTPVVTVVATPTKNTATKVSRPSRTTRAS